MFKVRPANDPFNEIIVMLAKHYGFGNHCALKEKYDEIEIFAQNGQKILAYRPPFMGVMSDQRALLDHFYDTLDKAFSEAATQRDLANGTLEVCL